MAKVKVEVLNAEVDGKKQGEQLSIEEKSANHLEAIGYVKKVKTQPKAKPKTQKKTEPKGEE